MSVFSWLLSVDTRVERKKMGLVCASSRARAAPEKGVQGASLRNLPWSPLCSSGITWGDGSTWAGDMPPFLRPDLRAVS